MVANVTMIARWPARIEDRESCGRRCTAFFDRVRQVFGNDGVWRDFNNKAYPIDDFGDRLQQVNDSGDTPMEELGWSGTFGLRDIGGVKTVGEGIVTSTITCGAYTTHHRAANMASVTLASAIKEDIEIYRRILPALVDCFEPSEIGLASYGAMERDLKLRRFPTVDWMLWLADTIIPPDELPMVYAVEHVGTGTLVILKKEPIDLSDPADLALVEAVEPIIRRHQPPVVAANQPEHRSLQ